MYVTKLNLKNFRCFSSKVFSFTQRFILVTGSNGSGKTSLLEAFFYLCYLRSFRTYSSRELIRLESSDKHFFIGVEFHLLYPKELVHSLTIGVTNKEKIVKLDQTSIKTYKELLDVYRCICIAEQDLFIVQGGPEIRRTLLNQALCLEEPGHAQILRKHKQIVDQRNKLLSNINFRQSLASNKENIKLWSLQLYQSSLLISKARKRYLLHLQKQINTFIAQANLDNQGVRVKLTYAPRIHYTEEEENFENFWKNHHTVSLEQECKLGRSLFGAHLDDFHIIFEEKKARMFASRGQQKLVVFLIKLSQIALLSKKSIGAVLLIDDFLTDLDQQRFATCVQLIQSCTYLEQIVITTPISLKLPITQMPQVISL